MKLKVGTIGYPVPEKLVYPHVDIVELKTARYAVPKAAVARKLRDAAPSNVAFSLQMPAYFFDSPPSGAALGGDPAGYGQFKVSEENRRLFERLNRFADNLSAETLVLLTPASFTPTPSMRDQLTRFLEEMPVGERRIVWQPSGPWTETQSAAFAQSLGMVLAVDPLRDAAPKGETAYFRLGPFAAMGSRVGIYDLERIAEAAAPFASATAVFETERALDDVRNLKQVLAG